MRQQKLLVCLLSTSLLMPSFPINDAKAETSKEDTMTTKSTETQKDKDKEKSDSSLSSSQNHKTNNEKSDDVKEKSSDNKHSSEREDQQNRKNDGPTKTSEQNNSQENDNSKTSDKTSTNVTKNTWDTSTDDDRSNIFDMFKPTPLKQNQDNNSLSKLLDQLLSNNEATQTPSTLKQNDDSNEDNNKQNNSLTDHTDSEDSNATAFIDDNEINDDSNEDSEESVQEQSRTDYDNDANDTARESENSQYESNQYTDEHDAQQDDTESNSDSHQNQSRENTTQDGHSQNKQDDETTTSNNDTGKQDDDADTRDNDSTTDNQSGSSSEDRVLESILDEYSEDAKNNQKQYESQKAHSSNKDSENKKSDSDEQPSSNHANPQLPSQSQLAKKEKPAQSFENDTKQSNIRTTAIFQQLPNLSGDNNTTNQLTITENKNTRDFIKTIAQDAHDIGQDEDIYASVMIAQAILESDSGMSALAQAPHYNLFGIKGTYQGKSTTFNTLEDNGNNMFQISADFRSYPSEKESLEDYAKLIKQGIDGNPNIYKPTWKREAHNYRSATAHLATTYATDSQYADKLNSIIEHYDLTQFDRKQMPDLDDYKLKNDDDNSDFKPFSETTNHSPYPHGQCTWYVYHRMSQFDQYVGGDLGDARNWNNRAERKGYTVSSTPKTHTAVVFEAGQHGADSIYGHVAFVEKVNDDGSIVISESNVKGLGIVSHRTIDADVATDLSYITGKQN